jgi:serine/threonine-protein kinase HipA
MADLIVEQGRGRWVYRPQQLESGKLVSPDPAQLPLRRGGKGIAIDDPDGLPGVVRDAMPAGYGADFLDRQAGKTLTHIERLEAGPADGVGALEVCDNIERKLAWRPHDFEELEQLARSLEEQDPSSRAIRRLQGDGGTSAGGERPKVTVYDDGRWWLAKMRDRGDIPWLPAKEFVAMSLARDLDGEPDLRMPAIRYVQAGAHAIFLIERFDRCGKGHANLVRGQAPQRLAFASAHTALRLRPDTIPGDPARSYLGFADELRRWGNGSPWVAHDCAELWRRMATNALVGNTDDHPRNHGLLLQDGHWRLSPVFDVTPISKGDPVLRMAVHRDGSAVPTVARLLDSASYFGVDPAEAAAWLKLKSDFIARSWRQRMRDLGVPMDEVELSAVAYAFATRLADHPGEIDAELETVTTPNRRMRPRQ